MASIDLIIIAVYLIACLIIGLYKVDKINNIREYSLGKSSFPTVILVKLPNNKRERYRWITRKNENDRYYARAPKIGVLIRELNLKRDKDFNKEVLLPKNTIYNK